MPRACSCPPGPTPDSSNSCTEPIDPAARITSPRQRAALAPPSWRQRTPTGALAVEHDALHQAAGLEPQVRPLQRRLEKAARRRPAPPAMLVDVERARALVVAGIEIRDAPDAGLLGRLAERIEDVPAHPRRRDPQLAADGVMIARPQKMMLMPFEERQHVVGAPAGKPELAPMVVVGGLAAHIDHGVDGGGAADHLAARIIEAAAVEPLLRLGLEHPVRARIADGEQVADRDMEPNPIVPPAGLEQQHAAICVGGEPVGQHAAGGAGADDDVVVLAFQRCWLGHDRAPGRFHGTRVPVPTFVCLCSTHSYERRNQRETSNSMILVWLWI